MGLDGIEFAGLDQRRDGCPVCGTGIGTGEEGILSARGDGSDCAFDGVFVHLDPAIGEEQAKAGPVFCDVFQRLAQGGFGGHAGPVVGEPCFEPGDLWRCLILADGEADSQKQFTAKYDTL